MNLISVHLCLVRILHEVQLKSWSSWMEIISPYRGEEEEGGSFKVTADFCNLLMIPLESFWKHPGDKWMENYIINSFLCEGTVAAKFLVPGRVGGVICKHSCSLQPETTLAGKECPHPCVLSSYVSNYLSAIPLNFGTQVNKQMW